MYTYELPTLINLLYLPYYCYRFIIIMTIIISNMYIDYITLDNNSGVYLGP